MAKDAVTLVDVAHAAGVSIATASRALTGKNRVSKQTIAHVTSVAAQLGYRVNVFGRALREGTNGTIGVVVPVVGNPFYGQLVHSLEEELQKHGLELVIADSHGEVDREQSRMRMLVDRRVEGIVVVPADAHLSAAALSDTEQSVPVVQLDRRVPGASADFVGIDNRAAMQAIVAHLVEQGATSIVLSARTTPRRRAPSGVSPSRRRCRPRPSRAPSRCSTASRSSSASRPPHGSCAAARCPTPSSAATTSSPPASCPGSSVPASGFPKTCWSPASTARCSPTSATRGSPRSCSRSRRSRRRPSTRSCRVATARPTRPCSRCWHRTSGWRSRRAGRWRRRRGGAVRRSQTRSRPGVVQRRRRPAPASRRPAVRRASSAEARHRVGDEVPEPVDVERDGDVGVGLLAQHVVQIDRRGTGRESPLVSTSTCERWIVETARSIASRR